MNQLAQLATKFPNRFVHTNPSGGGSYVSHDVVTQRLLFVLGPFDFELVQVLRGDVAAIEPNPDGQSARAKRGAPGLTQAVVGAVCRLRCQIDGRTVTVEEVGDCESPQNWPHDGARMKDAMSDAIKRAAMRLGCGLFLWSQEEYVLDQWLAKRAEEGAPKDVTPNDPSAKDGTGAMACASELNEGEGTARAGGLSTPPEATVPEPLPLGATK